MRWWWYKNKYTPDKFWNHLADLVQKTPVSDKSVEKIIGALACMAGTIMAPELIAREVTDTALFSEALDNIRETARQGMEHTHKNRNKIQRVRVKK